MIKEVSKARVHVERVISHLKDWRCLAIKNQQMFFWATHLVHVCGFLTNLQKLHLEEGGRRLVRVQKEARDPTPGPAHKADIDPGREERLQRAQNKAHEARSSAQARQVRSLRQAVRVRRQRIIRQQRIYRAGQLSLRARNDFRERQARSFRRAKEIRAKRLAAVGPHASRQ